MRELDPAKRVAETRRRARVRDELSTPQHAVYVYCRGELELAQRGSDGAFRCECGLIVRVVA